MPDSARNGARHALAPLARRRYTQIMENGQQALYWAELVDLKVGCEYIRRYRDGLAATMTRFAVIRAVVSVSALGAWAAVKSYPMLWGGIIAAAQVWPTLCKTPLPSPPDFAAPMPYAPRSLVATTLTFLATTLTLPGPPQKTAARRCSP